MSILVRYLLLSLLCLLIGFGSLLLLHTSRSNFVADRRRIIPSHLVHVIFGMIHPICTYLTLGMTPDFGGKPFGLIHYLSIKVDCHCNLDAR